MDFEFEFETKRYSNLVGPERVKWKLFERFKASLIENENEENSESQLLATNGAKGSADTLFVLVLSSLKKMAMEYLDKLAVNGSINDDEIQWVLTVPAVWSEAAKQKMRAWAVGAKMVDPNIRNQCRIVSERDCAALALRERYHAQDDRKEDDIDIDIDVDWNEHLLSMEMAMAMEVPIDLMTKLWSSYHEKASVDIDPEIAMKCEHDRARMVMVEEDDAESLKYVVVDAGGRTVDIGCHSVLSGKCVKSICARSVCIEHLFQNLFSKIFGRELIEEYMDKFPNIFMEIMDNFEAAKCSFFEDAHSNSHSVVLPFEFVQFAKRQKLEILENGILLDLEHELLVLDAKIWKFMFDAVMESVTEQLQAVLSSITGCKWLYLVGTWSCSQYFQYRMKSEFERKGLKVVPAENPTLSVVAGAAYFALSVNDITARRARWSYGVRVTMNMNEAKLNGIKCSHIKDVDVLHDTVRIHHCFHVLLHKNELLQMNESKKVTLKSKQKASHLAILKSPHQNPKIQSDGEIVGLYQIEYDENGRAVVEFHFGDNDFAVYTYSELTPQKRRLLKEIAL